MAVGEAAAVAVEARSCHSQIHNARRYMLAVAAVVAAVVGEEAAVAAHSLRDRQERCRIADQLDDHYYDDKGVKPTNYRSDL